MRKIIAALAFAVILLIAQSAEAQTITTTRPEVRALLHGTRPFSSMQSTYDTGHTSPWSLAFWLIEPNVLDSNPQMLGVIGPRFDSDNFWVEVLGGVIASPLEDQQLNPALDVRFMVTRFRHLHIWCEGTVFADSVYSFLQADIPVHQANALLFKVGVETEAVKTWKGYGGFAGAGPHVILPWNDHITTVAALQWRYVGTEADASWDRFTRLYVVVDL